MLEMLRAYGAGQLEQAGEQEQALAALAGYALAMAEEAAAGLQTRTGEQDAARWLDAEDATIWQVLTWAVAQDTEVALRLVAALGWWWSSRGRLPAVYPLLHEVAQRTEPGSDGWCTAQYWLGYTAVDSADNARALEHFTALRDAVADRPQSRALAGALAGRSVALSNMDRIAEAAGDARRSLAVAREVGYPAGEALALLNLSITARADGDHDDAVRLARQAAQIPADIPGLIARWCSWMLAQALTDAGDLAAAESVCAAGLARSRDAGDLQNQASLLRQMAILDLQAGRAGDAAAHLRESLELAARTGSRDDLFSGLDWCGHLCARTGRCAEAVTVWAAFFAFLRHERYADMLSYARRRDEPLREARQALEAVAINVARG